MNAKELVFRGEDATKLYACGNCGLVYSPKIYAARDDVAHEHAQRAAEDCCAPRHCACGVEIEKHWTACAGCRERNKLARATVVPQAEYSGPVYLDGYTGSWGEGYSESVGDFLGSCEDYDEPEPAYCHPCTSQKLEIDAESILEHALEEMHEDAADLVVDDQELLEFIEGWNKKQTCVTYYADTDRVIVLDQGRFDAMIAPADAGPAQSSEGDAP